MLVGVVMVKVRLASIYEKAADGSDAACWARVARAGPCATCAHPCITLICMQEKVIFKNAPSQCYQLAGACESAYARSVLYINAIIVTKIPGLVLDHSTTSLSPSHSLPSRARMASSASLV